MFDRFGFILRCHFGAFLEHKSIEQRICDFLFFPHRQCGGCKIFLCHLPSSSSSASSPLLPLLRFLLCFLSSASSSASSPYRRRRPADVLPLRPMAQYKCSTADRPYRRRRPADVLASPVARPSLCSSPPAGFVKISRQVLSVPLPFVNKSRQCFSSSVFRSSSARQNFSSLFIR